MEQRLTKALKGYDSSLFVVRMADDRLALYCERLLRPDAPEFVLWLTEDWTAKTPAREWGVLRIIAKLQEMRRGPVEVLDEVQRHNERAEQSRKRARLNDNEAFAKDWRRSFQKMTDGINTSTIAKTDRRRKKEKTHGIR